MDLKGSMDAIKSGAGLSNPVTSLTSSLTTSINTLLASATPAIVTYAQSLQAAVTAASTAAQNVVSSLPTKLPLMKAADNITAKMAASQGQEVAPGGGAAFNNAFAPVTAAKTNLTSLQNGLSPTVMSRLQAGNTSDLEGLNTGVTSANTSVSSSVTAASAGITDSINSLKAFSFAKFLSMGQPPHVQAVINNAGVSKPSYEEAKADVVSANAISPTVVTDKPAQNIPTPSLGTRPRFSITTADDNLAKIGQTDFVTFKDAYFNYANGLSSQVAAKYDEVQISIKATTDWKTANIPNSAAIKQAAESNPSDAAAQAAYQSAKTTYESSSEYIASKAKIDDYTISRNNILRLRTQWAKWVSENFVNATAGPTW
jgi:hypothetical protein